MVETTAQNDLTPPALLSGFRLRARNEPANPTDAYLMQALAENKHAGLTLAVRARWIALAITALLLVMNIPSWDVLYYQCILAALALIGWLQLRAGKVGRSRWELTLIFADIVVLMFGMLVPNPFFDVDWPTAAQYTFDNFKYFYIFLAAVTLGYSWRTVFAYGTWTAVLWLVGMVFILIFGITDPALTERLSLAVNGDMRLLELIDPSNVRVRARIEETVVFLIVGVIMAINSFRANQLLLRQASTTRERANLARHFPPNIVDQLAERDQPLGEIRAQNVTILFADIVGFTRMAENETPDTVITLLRAFHRLIEEAVFEHGGTLDKYLGDGVMVTFGTPQAGPFDAGNALRCTETLLHRMNTWNQQRQNDGLSEIKLSLGLHYGPVILGDIGSERRLEFATLGDTVNVASRLEELTRTLGTKCVISDQLVVAARQEYAGIEPLVDQYQKLEQPRILRGRNAGIVIWVRKDT